MGANMLNLGGKSLANDQYACACARGRQELSNTGFLPYHKPSLWPETGRGGGWGLNHSLGSMASGETAH